MIDAAAGKYKYAGSLEDLVKQQFRLSPTRYWQIMKQLLRTTAAAPTARRPPQGSCTAPDPDAAPQPHSELISRQKPEAYRATS